MAAGLPLAAIQGKGTIPSGARKTPPEIPDRLLKERGRRWIYGVEVFAAGPWNFAKYGKNWTPDDLASMEQAFTPTLSKVEPVVITNHGKDDDEGQNRGFVGRLYRNPKTFVDHEGRVVPAGHRLFADVLVDDGLYDGMAAARYRRPSVELMPDYKDEDTGKVYPWVLTALSIQGGKHIEAVRVLKPLAATVAAQQFSDSKVVPLHFRDEARGRAILVTFTDSKESNSMDEVKQMFAQIVSLLQQLLKSEKDEAAAGGEGAPNTQAAPEMAQKCEPKMDAAGGAAPVAVAAQAPAGAASGGDRQPSAITLKYDDAVTAALQERDTRIAALEVQAAAAQTLAKRQEERATVKDRVAKFAEAGNLRLPPARIDEVTDLALSVPASGKVLKFSDASGAEKQASPREAFFSLLDLLPDQTSKTQRQGKTLPHDTRAATTDGALMQFAQDVETRAKTEKIDEVTAVQKQLDEMDIDEIKRLAFPYRSAD